MIGRGAAVALFIIVMVVVIVAWSKLRHSDEDVYDAPQRWKLEDHPALRKGSQAN